MNILFNPKKVIISDRFKSLIQSKYEQSLGKLLVHYQEDLKIASLTIEKLSHGGYEIKFDMNLPGCAINVKNNHKILFVGLLQVRNQAKRQIKKHLEKLRGF